MITSAILQSWIQHPEQLNRDTLYQLRTAVECYPYFQSLRLLFLKNLFLLHDDTFGNELRKSIIYIPDRKVLFQLLEGEQYVYPGLQEEQCEQKDEPVDKEETGNRMISLIDHYLEEKPREPKPSTPVNYATDYVAYLLQQEDENPVVDDSATLKSHGDELIDGFIQDSGGGFKLIPDSPDEKMPEPKGPDMQLSQDDEGCFTETLAKIYIKQHRYGKALEIIRKLYLKNPKKNCYFADQIRFLEKLIINEKQK
jgi:hypothetical protein